MIEFVILVVIILTTIIVTSLFWFLFNCILDFLFTARQKYQK